MPKKEESVLGLVPLPPPTELHATSLEPFVPSRAITKEEQRVYDEWDKAMLVIDATATKGMFGVSKIAELHQHTSTVFDETVGYIMAVKEEPRSKEHQTYVDEFSNRQIQMLGRHLLGALEVSATNIGREISLSLHLPPEPPEPLSLMEKIFGRKK